MPSSTLIPVEDLAADRRLYLPMMALCAAAGLLLSRLPRWATAAVVLVLAALSVGRMEVWRTEEALWTEALERGPKLVRPRLQLARVVEPRRAQVLLDEAAGLAPRDARVATERGRYYLSVRRPAAALGEFGRALALEPRSALALNNRGVALLALGQREAARMDFERALKRDGCARDALENLRRVGGSFTPPPGCR
jgi:Tfp pilus assembly protein PilF